MHPRDHSLRLSDASQGGWGRTISVTTTVGRSSTMASLLAGWNSARIGDRRAPHRCHLYPARRLFPSPPTYRRRRPQWLSYVARLTALYASVWVATAIIVVVAVTIYAFPQSSMLFVSGITVGVSLCFSLLSRRRRLHDLAHNASGAITSLFGSNFARH